MNPSVMFDLLPRKFTAAQLRILYQLVYDKAFDVRNFHKKIALMPYVVPMEEKEKVFVIVQLVIISLTERFIIN